jgi:hypothetical protein
MNPRDYPTLEACQKLLKAGIVLETDAIWIEHLDRIVTRGDWEDHYRGIRYLPAPSMAEVWRELPESHISETFGACFLVLNKIDWIGTVAAYGGMKLGQIVRTNPTDALIDLLIWVRGKEKDEVSNLSKGNNDGQKKLLTEWLGECWHEWVNESYNYPTAYCGKCEQDLTQLFGDGNRTFLTDKDMMDCMRQLVKEGKWQEFCKFAIKESDYEEDQIFGFTPWLMRPTNAQGKPHFCRLVAEFKPWKDKK